MNSWRDPSKSFFPLGRNTKFVKVLKVSEVLWCINSCQMRRMAFGKTQGNIQSNVLSNFCIGKLILESDEIQVKIIGSGTIWLKFIYSEKATKFCKIFLQYTVRWRDRKFCGLLRIYELYLVRKLQQPIPKLWILKFLSKYTTKKTFGLGCWIRWTEIRWHEPMAWFSLKQFSTRF